MTVRQAAEILNVTVTTVRALCSSGRLKAKQVPMDLNQYGYRWEINANSVEAERVAALSRPRHRGRARGYKV